MKTRKPLRATYCSWEQLPLVMSLEEVAKLLRVSLRTVQTYAQKGLIPSVRFDGKTFVMKDKLKAQLEAA